MKRVKKLLSSALFVIMLMSVLVPAMSAGAVSLQEGKWALCEQFIDGEVPGSMDYVYYSPVKDKNDTTKYPLVVWLHGRSSGNEKRKQINSHDFSNWASDEYQARFENAGGAFLLLPRSNGLQNNWHQTEVQPLKELIDIFIDQYGDNIDTSKIYISGYSSGGTMVYYMVDKYPDFFAAMIPICAVYTPTTVQLDKWRDLSVWFVCGDKDPYVSANSSTVKTSFNYLSSVTNRKDGVRITTASEAVYADGSQATDWKYQHYVMDIVIYDMHMKDGSVYAYTTSKDSYGNTLNFENDEGGVIRWLSAQKRPEQPQKLSAWEKFVNFFRSIFKYIAAIFG